MLGIYEYLHVHGCCLSNRQGTWPCRPWMCLFQKSCRKRTCQARILLPFQFAFVPHPLSLPRNCFHYLSQQTKLRQFFCCLSRLFFLSSVSREFLTTWQRDITSALTRVFLGFLVNFFGCFTPPKKMCFSTNRLICFLPNNIVTTPHCALLHVCETQVICALVYEVDTSHIHTSEENSVFVCSPPSQSHQWLVL